MSNSASAAAAQSGLEYLQNLIVNWRGSPMANLMGMRLVAVADGTATIESHPLEKFYNPQRRTHGGYAAALIDSAMGSAVQTRLPAETGFGTIEMKVNFVRKIDESVGRLLCTAHVIHSGRSTFTAEARLVDGKGKLYAHGSGTFMVYPK